jgi:hypothetical protein
MALSITKLRIVNSQHPTMKLLSMITISTMRLSITTHTFISVMLIIILSVVFSYPSIVSRMCYLEIVMVEDRL